ncbi:MAG TPA: beta-lactamase family protein [Firmicutes bacterium]|nr:beta-lactamase family protein [Candidatus Fermentithermobacillaceae bacterium]
MTTRSCLETRVDEILAQFVSSEGPGVAVLIGRGSKVLVRKAYGLSEVETKTPLRADHRFIIGSVTKQFVGMCVMMLKHRGLLSYDEPVARFFPDFPQWSRQITIRRLLQQTSGLSDYLTQEFWRAVTEEGRSFSQEDIIDWIGSLEELEFKPGSRWRYSNSNYVLLGAIIEKAAGKSLASFMKENIFDPLGMRNTLVGESALMPENMAAGYEYKSKTEFRRAPYTREVVGWADGNVISTVDDLFLWAQSWSSSKLLPMEVKAGALVPWNPLNPAETRYGFGQITGERRGVREVHHGGATLGYNAQLSRFTDEELTVVLLSNAAGIGLDRILGLIAEEMLGDKMVPLVPASLPHEHLMEKAGRYCGKPRDSTMALAVEFSQESEALNATLYQNERCLRLYELVPLSRDLFLADRATDSYLEFVRDYSGTVAGVRIKSVGRITQLDKV